MSEVNRYQNRHCGAMFNNVPSNFKEDDLLTNNATILVIDDEASLLRSITAYLEDSGFIAKSAENGKEGLALFKSAKPDLVLTDLHMPVLGGLEVLSTITKQNPEIPVIVISGAGELNDAIEALRFGASDYITKPIADLAVLEHAVKKALERKKLLEENRVYAQRLEQSLKILEEDQAAGRKVQASLLPPNNLRVDNFTFKFNIIPSLDLSGDFVEYFQINQNLMGVYIADVSGHGVSSSFVTILLKGMVAKYNVEYHARDDDTITKPDKLMSAISEEFFIAKLGKYLTLIYGVLNLKTYEFTYSVGGHYPSPFLCCQDHSTKILEGRGFPVGIMSNVEYKIYTVKILPGEHLVMFSDGIMEAFMPNKSLEEKEEALLNILQNSPGDIPTILRSTDVTTKTHAVQLDDITILIIGHC